MPAPLLLLACLLAGSLIPEATAQGFNTTNGRNHPHLRWMEVETPHFLIRYPAHLSGIEIEAAAIAEASHRALSANLGVMEIRRKTEIFLSDEDEVVNGFANPMLGGYTAMWVHPNDVINAWTGPEKWLRVVLAHELGHIYHYKAVETRIGMLNYLLGNPTPRFWTEGIAQFYTEPWTAWRGEHILRTAHLESRSSYEDGTSMYNGRLLYATGNAQMRFFSATHGDSTVAKILAHRTRVFPGLEVHDFTKAFQAVTGQSYAAFNEAFRRHLTIQYGALAASMEPADSLGMRLRLPGQYIPTVAVAPNDTGRIAFIRRISMARPVTEVVVRERRRVRVLGEGAVRGPLAWHPEGTHLAWTATVRGENGSLISDLYLARTDGSHRERLTTSRRASEPTFSPDGQQIAFVGTSLGTSNIFLLNLETREERQLTFLTGDVQLAGLRWMPASPDTLALTRWHPDGRRTIDLLHVPTGELTSLTDGHQDDRHPVWSPDGRHLAYTSLRDGVPNIFRLDLESRTSTRITNIATGATAMSWLPADSLREEGRLVVLAQATKRNDAVYFANPARAPKHYDVQVPEHLTAWQRHAPTHLIPAFPNPDTTLILRRAAYRPSRNIKHAFTLPFPTGSGEAVGLGAFTTWIEPLGKHVFTGLGAWVPTAPDANFLLASYLNQTLTPSLLFNAYHFPGTAQPYGTQLLVEQLTGADVMARWPIDRWSPPYTTSRLETMVAVERSRPLEPERFQQLTDGLQPPASGTQARLSVGLSVKQQRPWRDNLIHPLDGYGARVLLTAGSSVDGGEAQFVRARLAAYTILPSIGMQRLYLYGRLEAQHGTSFPQNYVGLSRYDRLPISLLPDEAPIYLSDAERVRGFRAFAVGNRLAFARAEYRIPLTADLQTRILGIVGLGSTALAVFADAGAVWDDARSVTQRVGLGAEVKNTLRIGGLRIGHAVGIAQPAPELFQPEHDLYYRFTLGTAF